MQEIFNFFSNKISQKIDEVFKGQVSDNIHKLEEIRLRVGKPIILKFTDTEKILNEKINMEDMLETMQKICNNSIYSYQNQICSGYITIKGGHRVGIVGNCVIENNKVVNINYISAINFRISKQILGCSNLVMKHILNLNENSVYNTLIVSPPGVGKTTLLRDIIKNISSGISTINFRGLNVGLVDERGEIAALYNGIPQNDIGIRTDILDNVPKAIGIKMLIRSMAPQVICADEIGVEGDSEAIKLAVCSGVKGIFTAHGTNISDLYNNPILKDLLEICIFQKIIFLDNKKGRTKEIYILEENNYIKME